MSTSLKNQTKIFEAYKDDDEAHVASTMLLNDWSGAARMNKLNREVIAGYAASWLLFDVDRDLLGHVGIVSCEDGQAVLGGLVVNPFVEGQGHGTALVRHQLAQLPLQFPEAESLIANANEDSLNLFLKLGAVSVEPRTSITGCDWRVDLSALLPASVQSVTLMP